MSVFQLFESVMFTELLNPVGMSAYRCKEKDVAIMESPVDEHLNPGYILTRFMHSVVVVTIVFSVLL